MKSAPTVVDWLTLVVAGVGALTGIVSLFVSASTARSARQMDLFLARQQQHSDLFVALMRKAREVDGAAVALVAQGRYVPGGIQLPIEERRANYDAAYSAFIQAQYDVAALAPERLRRAAGRLGNLVVSFTNDPGQFADDVVATRSELDRLIRIELGTEKDN